MKIHAPAVTVAYHDFPLSDTIDPNERITSSQVFSYLKDFCIHFDLYKYMKFNLHVTSVKYDSNNKKSTLVIRDKNREFISDEYDYVIHTHGFTERTIPSFKSAELFKGEIYHSFDVNKELFQQMVLSDKKIVVLGASKTATDFILKFQEYGYKVSWICKKPYWFLRFENIKKWSETKGLSASKFILIFGSVFARYIPKTVCWIWQKFKIIHTFGKSHLDLKRFHIGILDENQIELLSNYHTLYGVNADIERLEENVIVLNNDQKIPADILICCTGSGAKCACFDLYLNEKKIDIESIRTVYRSRVIPQVPNLILTGFMLFSPGIVNGLTMGNWIAKYLEMKPDTKYLLNNATDYDYSFFSINSLFNSKHTLLSEMAKSYDSLIHSKEISRKDFLKYFSDVCFKLESVQPLEFNLPENVPFPEKQRIKRSVLMKTIRKLMSFF